MRLVFMLYSYSRQNFGSTSPLFSKYTAGRLCIRRIPRRCCRNFVSNQSRALKLTPSTHPQAVQKTWTIQNRYGYRYAKICIFPTVSLSNGRRLARLRDIRTWYGKRGVGCLTLLSCKVTSRGRCGIILTIASPATNEHNSVNCKFWQHLPCTVR